VLKFGWTDDAYFQKDFEHESSIRREGSSSQGCVSQDGGVEQKNHPWRNRHRQWRRSIPRITYHRLVAHTDSPAVPVQAPDLSLSM
jgi:hypothetical protein